MEKTKLDKIVELASNIVFWRANLNKTEFSFSLGSYRVSLERTLKCRVGVSSVIAYEASSPLLHLNEGELSYLWDSLLKKHDKQLEESRLEEIASSERLLNKILETEGDQI